ncbi:hypothetical protein OS493_024235, partial [Desmophyllum pertusum]
MLCLRIPSRHKSRDLPHDSWDTMTSRIDREDIANIIFQRDQKLDDWFYDRSFSQRRFFTLSKLESWQSSLPIFSQGVDTMSSSRVRGAQAYILFDEKVETKVLALTY